LQKLHEEIISRAKDSVLNKTSGSSLELDCHC
jgi:hypothetical protein